MRLRKQLELLQELIAEAKALEERSLRVKVLGRRLARAWDLEDARDPRAPRLPFPKPNVHPASAGESEEPTA